ncbi:toxin-antitoxin system HicB family antitoxin [Lysinibacillus capsici]|uniref:toxin-antitoxin system HicB family antitoxin n=1 Tax=Lysinibacillus capsici TaxID=2115968 RepID=UPI0034E2E0D0
MKELSGRILLRIPPELHHKVAEHASVYGKSINEYITQAIQDKIEKERVGFEVAMQLSFSKVSINDLKVGDVREAVIVTQHPWYMEILRKHKIYFFNPNLGRVTPMLYLLFYETTKQENDGSKNENPRHIAQYGKVQDILYDIQPHDYKYIPELESLMNDDKYWSVISNWETTNVVIMSEVGEFAKPFPLNNGLEARYLVNKTSSLPKLRNATYVDDLY